MAAASAAALAVGEIITLAQTVALARLLTPTEVGLYVAGGVLIAFVGDFVEGGLRSGLVHRDGDLDDAAATVFWVTLGTGVLMTLLALAAAPIIGHVFDSHTAGLVAAAMSGGVLLSALTNVPEALLQREFSVRRRLIVGPSVAATFAAVAVSAAALGLGVWSMVLGTYASSVVWVLSVWWLCDWRPGRGRPSYLLWRQLAGFGFPLVLGMLGDRAQKATQAVVTGSVLGAKDLGLQRYGERIARIPVMGLVQVSSVSLFPAFTRLAPDRRRFQTGYLHALRLSVVVAAATSAMVVAVGVPLVVIVLGEEWRGAGYALVSMAGLSLGKSASTVGEEAIKGAGRTRLINWCTLTETTLSVVLLLVLIRPLGLVGVGLSISLTTMVVGTVVAAVAAPVVGVSARQTLGATAPTIVSALVGCAAVVPLEHLVLHSESRGAWGLCFIVVDALVFLLVYTAALRVLAPTTFHDLTALLAVVRRRVLHWRRPRELAPGAGRPG
ncbi:oligosaccharide flippase family protein [Modestobacter excelsi]|uniref:oligosaccharide flippase family protein n=1 Tax=Modestobacter excelsi TaxID=2213161 RepID=UPI001C20CA5B|nr:oligosaccharide flippase family protein [Modestobacter excelsi]